ncbi:gluconokinase [Ornithinimicrobium sp. Arc0846-15]|nr:gluconokinase [Ornithinimicrobium laminariae]
MSGQPVTPQRPDPPIHIVVMGVSGCGKSTVGVRIAERLGWEYGEGDDYHPQANVDKMASGRPLQDEDRWPWLHLLADWTKERGERGESTVLSCSSLKWAYRDILRGGGERTFFVHLAGDKNTLMARMEGREHFMPPSLLESQLDALEPLRVDEFGMVQDFNSPPDRIARVVAAELDLS